MSALLEERAAQSSPAAQLRGAMAAMRLQFTWCGARKALSPEQKGQAAESFGAAGAFLSAGKKLFDTGHPRFKAVTAVRHQATGYFRGASLPFPEPAVRLVRRDDVEEIQSRMGRFARELESAVGELDAAIDELQRGAREQLGRLYAESDYPRSLAGLFAMAWDFPSVEPPEYLRRLAPAIYRQECRRVAARFDEAVRLTEAMFVEQLEGLVSHLADRLSGDADGKPKVFRDSAVTNLTEFFQRFSRLNIHSRHELESLVNRAQELMTGVRPQQLRDGSAMRTQLADELANVQASLDGLLMDRPRRNILRPDR